MSKGGVAIKHTMSNETSDSQRKPGKIILIIEDDADIRTSVADLLEAEGYTVLLAADGQDALEQLMGSSQKPDLILLDLMMPVKDGFQFSEEHRQNKTISDIPIVVMSADAQIDQKSGAMGGMACLRKPLDIDEVLATIKNYSSRND